MGFFDFFKGKEKVDEASFEEIEFEKVPGILDILLDELDKNLSSAKEEVGKIVDKFNESIIERVRHLEKIDLSGKREHDRLKHFTTKGLEDYITQLNRLVTGLKNLDDSFDLGRKLGEIDILFNSFIRGSRKKLSHATILIGDDLAKTEEVVKNFYKDLKKVGESNKDSLLQVRLIKEFKEFENSLEEIEDASSSEDKLASKADSNLEKITSLIEKTKSDIISFKKSEEFASWENEKKSLQEEISSKRKLIDEVRKKLDLKELSKSYHGTKTGELIKKYRDNFFETLLNDESLEMAEILKEEWDYLLELREKYLSSKQKSDSYGENSRLVELNEQLEKLEREENSTRKEAAGQRKKKEGLDEKILGIREKIVSIAKKVLEMDGRYHIKSVKN